MPEGPMESEMLADHSNHEAILAEDVVGYIQVFYIYQFVGPTLAQQNSFLGNQIFIHTETAEDVFYFAECVGIERREGKPFTNTTSLVGGPNAG